MSNNKRCFHAIRGFAMKFKDVERGIEQCALAWVVKGESFRDLTPQEAIIARNTQARFREPLGYAEIPGIHFELREGELSATNREMLLAYEAQAFFAAETA